MWGSPRTGGREQQQAEREDRTEAQPRLTSGEPQLRGAAGMNGRAGPDYRPTWGWKSVSGLGSEKGVTITIQDKWGSLWGFPGGASGKEPAC